jgi:hypothetical protein
VAIAVVIRHICYMDVATDRSASSRKIRKASRDRAPNSPMSGEHKDMRTARPDGEDHASGPALSSEARKAKQLGVKRNSDA